MSDNRTMDLATRAHWQKWEMDNIASLKQDKARDLKNHQVLLQKNKLKQQQQEVLEQAHKNGFDKGHQEGFDKGFNLGKEQGWQTGSEQGYEEGLKAGHTEGYQKGLALGRSKGDSQATKAAQELNTILANCKKAINSLEEETGQALIKLAIKIAEQVLRTQLQDYPNHIIAVVKEVLDSNIEPKTELKIRLNPTDTDLVKKYLDQSSTKSNYRLTADQSITAGGCIVETDLGTIDATLETRWHRIISALGYLPNQDE